MYKSTHRDNLIARLPQHSTGGEIGVHKGDFSRILLDKLSIKKLHLIDPWQHEDSEEYKKSWYGGLAFNGQEEMDERYESVLKKFDQEISQKKVVIHRGFSKEVLEQFKDGYFDWLYIDGNHLYEHVKEDLRLAYRKVKDGGLIVGDDYEAGGWWDGGVMIAVDEFCEKHPEIQAEFFGNQFLLAK